jgi:hypothetical protein
MRPKGCELHKANRSLSSPRTIPVFAMVELRGYHKILFLKFDSDFFHLLRRLTVKAEHVIPSALSAIRLSEQGSVR